MQEEKEYKEKKGEVSTTPNSSLLNILANSLQSSVKYQQTPANTETRNCSGCGAARPAGTDLAICDFCKKPFN